MQSSELTKEQIKDIIQWDVKSWSKALPFWEKHFDIKPGMKVLTIGEREGGLSLYFALMGCEVTCTDYNDFPEETARLHQRYAVSDYISYQNNIDVTDLSSIQDNTYDVVAFKSVIGALSTKERQQTALDEIHRVLKPGSPLLFAENLQGSALHRWLRKKYVSWNHYWRYLNLKTDMRLFEKFNVVKLKSTACFSNFGRSEKQRTLLSKIDQLSKPLTPSKWRYILMGVLIK